MVFALARAVGAVGVEEGGEDGGGVLGRGGGVGELEQEGGVGALDLEAGAHVVEERWRRASGLARPGRSRRLRRARGEGGVASQPGSMASKASAAIFSERRMPVSLSNMPTATTGARAPVEGGAGEGVDEERRRRGVERRRGGEPGEAEGGAGEGAEGGGAELAAGDGEEAAEVDEVAVGAGRRRGAGEAGRGEAAVHWRFLKGVFRKAIS